MMRVALSSALLAVLASGCVDAKVKALAGTYVTEYNEGPNGENVHSRTALTLRTDSRWTEASELVIQGKDMLAGGRVRDEMVPPGYVDSGTFALKGVILSVRSEKAGVFEYVVAGDTLWTHNGRMAALATAVTGVNADGGSEGFLVRQR